MSTKYNKIPKYQLPWKLVSLVQTDTDKHVEISTLISANFTLREQQK
jgi:hypothetical protein